MSIEAYNLGREFGRQQTRANQQAKLRGLTGIKRADNSISLAGDSTYGDTLPRNKVYVRLNGADSAPDIAWNFRVAKKANLSVWVEKNGKNEYTITGLIEDESDAQFLNAAPSLNAPPQNLTDEDERYWGAFNLLPGRIRLKTAGALQFVAEDFLYTDTTGKLRRWNADSGYVDLLSSVPGSSGQHNLALIALNPDAATPALTSIMLTARSVSWPFNVADLASYSVVPGYVPLGTVRLVNGDTTITTNDRIDYAVRYLVSAYRPSCRLRVTNTAADYTALLSDELICVTNTGAARTITLPAASTCFASGFGQTFTIADKSGGAGTNNITAVTVGGDTLLGTGVISTNYGKIVVQAVSATEFLIL